jgi:hypothetical protein
VRVVGACSTAAIHFPSGDHPIGARVSRSKSRAATARGPDEHQPLRTGVGDEPPVGRDLRRATEREPVRRAPVVARHPDHGVRGPEPPAHRRAARRPLTRTTRRSRPTPIAATRRHLPAARSVAIGSTPAAGPGAGAVTTACRSASGVPETPTGGRRMGRKRRTGRGSTTIAVCCRAESPADRTRRNSGGCRRRPGDR